MSVSIEELKEEKTFYKRERDALGNVSREPYQAKIKRKVNVVNGWQRFGHYMIDFVILYGMNFGLGFLIAVVNPTSEILTEPLYSYAIGWTILVAYYFISENTMQRTIGKFATKSVVINEYAQKPSNEQLIGRSFARLVPFEAFSCLADRGWHDTWSKTYVVTEKERDELQRLLNKHEGNILSNSEDLLD